MRLQLLQMQHTDNGNPNQSGADKEPLTVAVVSTPLLPLNESAAGAELLVFCIQLFSTQTSSVVQSISFSGLCLFSSLPFLIIVSIGNIHPVTMKSLLSVLFPSVQGVF